VKDSLDGATVVFPLMLQYKLTSLNPYVHPALETNVPEGKPNTIVENMSIEDFFNYLNRLLILNPPLPADEPFMEKIKEIGIAPGAVFELDKFSPDEKQSMELIPQKIISKLREKQTQSLIKKDRSKMKKTGNYGTNYFYRAYVALFGLGANLPEVAIYLSYNSDEKGKPLNGQNKYQIRFENGKLPPANAFWSLSMYDSTGTFIHNELDRYALGDRSDLTFNHDGSLIIYIQHKNPENQKTNNWLPAPSGNFNMLLRVYYPKQEMLNDTWKTPAVRKK
jgi:hypothetical protein